MKKFCAVYLFLSLLLLLCLSCTEKTKKEDKTLVQMESPAFDADSAFAFVKAQTDFGPRVPNTQAHERCADYLISHLHQFCDTVEVQSFDVKAYDGNILHSKNIMGRFSVQEKKRILLAAHWDSRHLADHDPLEENRNHPIDGANDGASGVGVLMELARQLNINHPGIGVDILFFDAEDYGTPNSVNVPGDWWGLGSQYWAKQAYKSGYTADFGILLDMVGASNATFYHEYFSDSYASDVVSKVWGMAYKLGYGAYFLNESAHPITDDHLYVNQFAHIKMIDIIHQDKNSETGFPVMWHTVSDNIQNIDKNTLYIVGTTLLAVIQSES